MSDNNEGEDNVEDFEIFHIGDTINVVAYSIMAVGMQ